MILESRHRRFLSEINIIPLVDVVLVLLVIFMVTAPMLHRGIDITLPQSSSNTIKPDERLIISVESIESDEAIYIGKDRVTIISLRKRLHEAKALNPLVSVYLRADSKIPYGRIVQVMDEVKRVGIKRLGMVTSPKGEGIDEESVELF